MTVNSYERRWVPMNSGRNGAKRKLRAMVESLKGMPGWGWKRRLRQLQAAHRASGARMVPPHRSGGRR